MTAASQSAARSASASASASAPAAGTAPASDAPVGAPGRPSVFASFFHPLGGAAQDWLGTEGKSWLFIGKAVLAALLALYLAMRLELPSPRTALMTVFIVMTPQSGMVWAKSFYRLLGTAVGVSVTLVLISLFSQTRELFLLSIAIWIGICTAGAAWNRNFRSYGFVLAGYTTALVGLPNVEMPLGAFDASVTRAIEVSLGIICSGVVSSVVFPTYSSTLLRGQVRARFVNFVAFVRDATGGKITRAAMETRNMGFIADVVGMEALRSFSIFEDSLARQKHGRVARLNAESMAASTRFHALHQLMNRVRTQAETIVVDTMTPYLDQLAAQLTLAGEPVRHADDAAAVAAQLDVFRLGLPREIRATRAAQIEQRSPEEQLDFDTASELLYRFVDDLHRYVSTYASLALPTQTGEDTEPPAYVSKTSGLMACVAGLRATVAILLTSAFWILSGWPSGNLAVLMTAAACALISAMPKPVRSTVHFGIGGALACVCGYVCTFYVLAERDGFLLMATGILPFLMFGAWLLTRRKWMLAGVAYCIFFGFLAGPDNVNTYDPISYLNSSAGLMVAVLASTLAFSLLLPPTTPWLLERMRNQLRRQIAFAAHGTQTRLAHRFDSGTRDYMFQIGALTAENPALQRNMLGWMFSVLEIGHALIELRHEFDTLPARLARDPRYAADAGLRSAARAALAGVVALFSTPGTTRWNHAFEMTGNAIAYTQQMLSNVTNASSMQVLTPTPTPMQTPVNPDTTTSATAASPEPDAEPKRFPGDQHHEDRRRLQRILSYLHFVRTALLDEHSPLHAYATPVMTAGTAPASKREPTL